MFNFKAISLCGMCLQTVLADFQNYQNKNTHVKAQTNHHTHTSLCIIIEEYRNSDLKPSNSIQVLVSLLINYQKLTHQLNVLHFPKANKKPDKRILSVLAPELLKDKMHNRKQTLFTWRRTTHVIYSVWKFIPSQRTKAKDRFKNRLSKSKDYQLATYLISAYLYVMKASKFLHIWLGLVPPSYRSHSKFCTANAS